MKRANDYYKERGLMSPDEYYNKVEELLSNGKAKEYNDFIQHTPLTYIDHCFLLKILKQNQRRFQALLII